MCEQIKDSVGYKTGSRIVWNTGVRIQILQVRLALADPTPDRGLRHTWETAMSNVTMLNVNYQAVVSVCSASLQSSPSASCVPPSAAANTNTKGVYKASEMNWNLMLVQMHLKSGRSERIEMPVQLRLNVCTVMGMAGIPR